MTEMSTAEIDFCGLLNWTLHGPVKILIALITILDEDQYGKCWMDVLFRREITLKMHVFVGIVLQ